MMKKENFRKPALLGITLGLVLVAATPVWAAKSRASCYLLNKKGETVQGVNIDQRYEIASVSKIMTSLWALSVHGADYRYETKIHVLPVGKDLFDVHISGSADPFYNREQLQFVVSQLNEMGIKTIRTLSFDENFKYLASTRESSVVIGHYGTSYPGVIKVESELRKTIGKIADGYEAAQRRGKEISEIELPKTIELKVSEIKTIKSSDFRLSEGYSSADTRHFVQKSVPLMNLLKEMNRSSNNYAANVIFESLGGAGLFQEFAKTKMGLEEAQIRFMNGSGDRLDLEDGKSAYNEATCQAIVATIGTLKTEVELQKHELADILAVAGSDAEGERSTVSSIYANESTSKALLAKTGTVSPSVTLAGMASTEQGDVYFGYIYGAEGTKADWREARNGIRRDVVALFKLFTGKKMIDYEAEKFITFDSDSAIAEVQISPPKVDAETDQVSRAAQSARMAVLRQVNAPGLGSTKVQKP